MPTTATSATKASKPRAKAAAKAPAAKAGARRSAARKPAAKAPARRSGAASRAATAKGARNRALHQTERAAQQSEIAARETAAVFGEYAERAVLIPVGAALLARDRVVSTVTDTLAAYSSGSKAQAQLRRFERRGATARNRLEREVRKARVRVERQLRQRRRAVEHTVGEIDERREALTRNGSELAGRVPEFAREVQERILSLV